VRHAKKQENEGKGRQKKLAQRSPRKKLNRKKPSNPS
jgi:hypothetical protein